MAGDIESLPFFKDRVELAGPQGAAINRIKCNDRTVLLIRKWQSLNMELKAARSETMSCLEASEGKGGAVVLKIADRPRFDSLQATISSHNEQIAALETAIRRLDAMGELWFSDLEYECGSYGRVEVGERRRIANMGAAVLQRRANTGKPTDEILAEDPEFQRLKGVCENTISDANKRLETLRPRLEEMKAILEGVGC